MITRMVLNGLKSAHGNPIVLDKFGKVTSIVGPNSSGKTTLLFAIKPVLEFLGDQVAYAPIPATLTPWHTVESAEVEFTSEEEPFALLPFSKATSAIITIGIKQESKHFIVSMIKTDKEEHVLEKASTPSSDAKRIAQLRKRIEVLKKPVALPTTRPPVAKNLERYVASTKSPTPQQLEAHSASERQRKDELRKAQDELNLISTGAYLYRNKASGEGKTVQGKDISALLRSVTPKIYYIPCTGVDDTNVLPLTEKSTISKKGKDTTAYINSKLALSSLLEANCDFFEEANNKGLISDGVDFEHLSTGARYCVSSFALLQNLPKDAVVIWDEPENGLHATRRMKLMQLLCVDTRQFIMATHATEFCGVLDQQCEVYRLAITVRHPFNFTVDRVTNRRHGFILAEDLGIRPSTTLFTASVVIWVEGPSDLLFWRYWINQENAEHGLIEGFDYTFMMYGGSNLSNMTLDDEQSALVGFDLLALCRHPFVIVDSDFDVDPGTNPEDKLKDAARSAIDAIKKINSIRPNSGGFFWTAGREVENYLPDLAVSFAVGEMLNSDQLLAKADLANLHVDTWVHYYDAIEAHLVKKGVYRINKNGDKKAIGRTRWGEKGKVEFMRRALLAPGLTKDKLNNGQKHINELIKWIKACRQR